MMPTFSLRWLLIAVGYIAFGCAALFSASSFWWILTYSLSLTLLFSALLGTIYRVGAKRAFWVGVSIFGWGYILLMVGIRSGSGAGALPTGSFTFEVQKKAPAWIFREANTRGGTDDSKIDESNERAIRKKWSLLSVTLSSCWIVVAAEFLLSPG